MPTKKIGELLIESGLITESQLKMALRECKEEQGLKLGAVLIKMGFASEIDIAQTLAFQLNMPFVDIASESVDPEVTTLVNEKLAKKYLLMPLYKEGRVLKIAMTDPLNLNAIDDIRFSTELDIEPCVATISDVTTAIRANYHLLNEPIDEMMGDFKKETYVEVIHDSELRLDISEHIKQSSAPPIIRMVDSMITQAVDNRASDIHLEPQENQMKLRVRIDGIMRETLQLPKWVQGPVTSRIKLMARMDITERRVPQDGRIKVRLGKKKLDLRVSTLPTQYGETVVMRVLDPKSAIVDLKGIGLERTDLQKITEVVGKPQGMVLVTGPTGSGKTSTLYSIISHIKKPEINIITLEDPIEYELKDINQVAVNEKTGLTFSSTLRSVLRQDPDVILVGEMRDAETAQIALQASITGHLVFSTLHTNDALSCIVRLKNMGIPQYMIASALTCVVAQRLVRKICQHCKEPYIPSIEELEKTGITLRCRETLYRGRGCKKCGGTGYMGRMGVFEVLTVNNRMKKLIASDADEQEIMTAVAASGMVSLYEDGTKKVLGGLTTISELSRVVCLPGEAEDMPV
ncbi:MAG: Flp pilus assembly complex ATPase component TadA [Deltaproteobacteria bacterium]|nr:Flp pilus assembly complex ATPase component TadA [Deltaproteobacteria bacterium]